MAATVLEPQRIVVISRGMNPFVSRKLSALRILATSLMGSWVERDVLDAQRNASRLARIQPRSGRVSSPPILHAFDRQLLPISGAIKKFERICDHWDT
jgi:hypothetical protein